MENLEKESNESGERIKKKVKEWLKDPYTLAFIGILIFAFIIRLYYFILTKNQPLWWDEAEYMAAAKSYVGLGDYQLGSIRLPGFPLLMSIFFILGITSEPIMRFIVLFIPSLIVIFLTYLMIKEMYPDKRIALISTAIISVLWEHLFYSNRFHTENFSLIFGFLAFFVLFYCYINKKNFYFINTKYSLIWIVIFSMISIFFRPGNIVFFPALFLFFIILKIGNIRDRFGKKGVFIILFLISIFIVAAYFSLYLIPKGGAFSYAFHPDYPLAWNVLRVFGGFYQSSISWIPPLFLYVFILGIFISLLNIFLILDKLGYLLKNHGENVNLKSDVFNMLLIASVLSFFILIIRPYNGYEYRWFFPLLPGMLVFTSKGILSFSDYVGNNLLKKKNIAVLLIIIISSLGIYAQIVHADSIIKIKIDSYSQVKEAGLWLKDNSNPQDIIVSASIPQHSYYSERKIIDFYVNGSNENETAFDEKIKEIRPRYIVISMFEPGFTPNWAYDWPQRNNKTVIPVKVYYLDKEQQPVLIIYELKY